MQGIYTYIIKNIFNSHTIKSIQQNKPISENKISILLIPKIDKIDDSIFNEWSILYTDKLHEINIIHEYTSSKCESVNNEIKSFLSSHEYWTHGEHRIKYCIMKHNCILFNTLDQLFINMCNILHLPIQHITVQQHINKWIHSCTSHHKRKISSSSPHTPNKKNSF